MMNKGQKSKAYTNFTGRVRSRPSDLSEDDECCTVIEETPKVRHSTPSTADQHDRQSKTSQVDPSLAESTIGDSSGANTEPIDYLADIVDPVLDVMLLEPFDYVGGIVKKSLFSKKSKRGHDGKRKTRRNRKSLRRRFKRKKVRVLTKQSKPIQEDEYSSDNLEKDRQRLTNYMAKFYVNAAKRCDASNSTNISHEEKQGERPNIHERSITNSQTEQNDPLNVEDEKPFDGLKLSESFEALSSISKQTTSLKLLESSFASLESVESFPSISMETKSLASYPTATSQETDGDPWYIWPTKTMDKGRKMRVSTLNRKDILTSGFSDDNPWSSLLKEMSKTMTNDVDTITNEFNTDTRQMRALGLKHEVVLNDEVSWDVISQRYSKKTKNFNGKSSNKLNEASERYISGNFLSVQNDYSTAMNQSENELKDEGQEPKHNFKSPRKGVGMFLFGFKLKLPKTRLFNSRNVLFFGSRKKNETQKLPESQTLGWLIKSSIPKSNKVRSKGILDVAFGKRTPLILPLRDTSTKPRSAVDKIQFGEFSGKPENGFEVDIGGNILAANEFHLLYLGEQLITRCYQGQ